jgi:hypothetical protein
MKRGWFVMLVPLVLWALVAVGCGRNNDELKIVIDEKGPSGTTAGPGTEAPAKITTPAAPIPGPETPTPPPETTVEKGPALVLPVTEVVSLVENDPEIAKLLTVVPAWMTVAARPADSLWDVRLSLREAPLFDLVVDDASGSIRTKRPHLAMIKKVREGLEKRTGHLYKEAMGRPVISLAGAVKAALGAGGVRGLDYTRGFVVSVGIDRLADPPAGEVVIDYKDGGPIVHVTLDGTTGAVLGVRGE